MNEHMHREKLPTDRDQSPTHNPVRIAAGLANAGLGELRGSIVSAEENSNGDVVELSPEEKASKIRDILTQGFDGDTPDALFSFSGGIKEDPKTGDYKTLAFSDLSEHGLATGSRTRVIATAQAADALPGMKIVTNSFNRFDPEEPTMASVVKSELMHRGVDSERIIEEEDSFSTITQLTEMVEMALETEWSKITVMTNEFHFPRMIAMYNNLDTIINDDNFQDKLKQFKAKNIAVEFVTAESIMRTVSNHFTRYLEEVAASEPYAKTVASEAKGLRDLEDGKYRVTLTPEQPRNQK